MTSYFGKYRGTVANNTDPQLMGRVQVQVPAVLGEGRLSWAMPCAPYAGNGVGFFFTPPVGANLWVEFEGGDPDYPIWAGGFWGIGEAPTQLPAGLGKVLVTDSFALEINEAPGVGATTFTIGPPAVPVPLKVTFDKSGIEIATSTTNIKLSLATVSVNNGALEVI